MLDLLRRFSFPAVVVLGLFATFSIGSGEQRADAATADWPQYLGPHRNGISDETDWLAEWPDEGPKIAWKANLGTGFSSFAVVENRVYASGHDTSREEDNIFCFDADTGEILWTYSYKTPLRDKQHEGGPASTPAVTRGKVFTLSREGIFFCLDAENGSLVWRKDLKDEVGAKIPTWAFSGSALIDGDRVLIDVGKLVALEISDGEVVWQSKEYGAAYSSPAPLTVGGKKCFAFFPEFGLVVVDGEDGSEIVRVPWETSYGVNAATPLVFGPKVFISSGYNRGCALVDLSSGKAKVLWENKNMRNHFNTSIYWKGHFYGFDDKTLACIDAETGETVWNKRGFGKGSLTFADEKLIILSERGELLTAEATPQGFKPISRWQVLSGKCWTVPVLSGHRIYARNAEGDFVCVDVRK